MAAETPTDAGMPQSNDAWPDGLRDHLTKFLQGDLVTRPPLLYHADLGSPVWARTHAYAAGGQTGEEPVSVSDDSRPPYGVITTQTCDIGEEEATSPNKPWVQVAPVWDGSTTIDSGFRKKLKKGGGPAYLFHMPDVPAEGFWVADLRIEVPVEKGWLLGQEPIHALPDATLRRKFAETCSSLRGRTAFSGPFVATVQRPLVSMLSSLKREDPDRFEVFDAQVEEARVLTDDPLNPTAVQVVLIGDSMIDDDVRAWLDSWWDEQRPLASEVGITLQQNDYRTFAEMRADEYRGLYELSLDRVSPA